MTSGNNTQTYVIYQPNNPRPNKKHKGGKLNRTEATGKVQISDTSTNGKATNAEAHKQTWNHLCNTCMKVGRNTTKDTQKEDRTKTNQKQTASTELE